MWSGFRVGRRARVTLLTDSPTCVEGNHDGYTHLGERHTRRWTLDDAITLRIEDHFLGKKLRKNYQLHFNPSLYLVIKKDAISATNSNITLTVSEPLSIDESDYELATGFNCTRPAQRLTIAFSTDLTTVFTIRP